MQKMTLLAMVQNILSALDSDEVNSISDTVESLQVAEIVKETFYEQFNNILVPELRGLIQLESVSDFTRPNYLRIPSTVSKLEWVKYRDYRNNGKFRDLEYLTPEEFLHIRLMYHSGSDSTVATVDPSGIEYYIQTDRTPTHYTLFDDLYLATDSYDLDSESVLQSSNTIAFGWKTQEFELDDDYIPPIDASLFPLLLAEAKSTAFINLKQISSSKEEQRSRRQRIRMQNDQFRSRKAQGSYRDYPDFSRKR